ncbi:hypothetical protein BsWGS_21157 [Bradybaena similaris]
MAEEKSYLEDLAIPDIKEEVFEQRQAETLKLSSRKHKRKTSPTMQDDIPTKLVKTEQDLQMNTTGETSEMNTSTTHAGSIESNCSEPVTTLKRSANDKFFETPCKKLKTDSLTPDEGKKKHVRRRMKHLLQAVIDQMEFYFGDSNLSKDRYLRQVIDMSADGYVDLAEFRNFNKLQSLHKDGVSLQILAAAISKSRMLELSDDGSKVRRITPIKEIDQEEIDSKTVYVEHLPAHASHMWIRSIFSQCGKVVYVSLPVYKTTRMTKGFGFVEFDTPDEAAKACQLLNNPLPMKSEDKPGKFPKGNKTLNRLQKLAPVKIEQDSNEENISDDQKTDASQNKTATSSKKKKNTKKKKKPTDPTADESNLKLTITEVELTEENKKKAQAEGKKKKKKKKKKQNQHADGVTNKEKEKSSRVGSGTRDAADVAVADVTGVRGESIADGSMGDVQTPAVGEALMELKEGDDSLEMDKSTSANVAEEASSKKKKKKKRKGDKKQPDKNKGKLEEHSLLVKKIDKPMKCDKDENADNIDELIDNTNVKLSRKERKRLRQEDIRRKRLEREGAIATPTTNAPTIADEHEMNSSSSSRDAALGQVVTAARGYDGMASSDITDISKEDKCRRRNDGSELTSILKSKKGQERKKVEFDPVTVTNEFIKAREVRKRKKPKKEKLRLRVIAKKEWLSLKAEYIAKQKSHMAALKESLRELRLQENQGQPQSNKRVDLEDVFGTKRLKPSQDLKMAHVEALKFTPNVIVQWKCSHDMPRDKIRTMFKELSGDSIAYIDASEEAKFGYIRFKDEASAEEFAKLSRRSASFMARVLPADQQEEYWKKANEDRVKKLGRKKHEKGANKIARKVFERNKATFFQKPSHIVFNDEDESTKDNKEEDKEMSNSESKLEESAVRLGGDESMYS